MATFIVLRHLNPPDDIYPPFREPRPPVRLILVGGSLVTDIEKFGSSVQIFPSPGEAKEHLERVLRLRMEAGYSIQETGELAEDEAARLADPMAHLVQFDAESGRMAVDFGAGPVSPEDCAEIVARIATTAPSRLDYSRSPEVPGGLFGAALAGQTLPSVKSLVFSMYDASLHLHPPPLDELADVLAALPSLERVDATGQFTLREASHGCLLELCLEGNPLSPAILAALGAGSLPALSTLGLSLGAEHQGHDRLAGAALRSLAAPRLRAVHVTGLTDITHFLAELTERPVPGSWATLHLMGSIGDEDELLAVLRARAPALGSLATLALPLADYLSEGGGAVAKALLPSIVEIGDVPDFWSTSASSGW